MWLFTSKSFVSIVVDKDNPYRRLVRARCKGSIEELFPDADADVFEDETADYLYRAFVPVEVISRKITEYIHGMEYANFKYSIPQTKKKYYDAGIRRLVHPGLFQNCALFSPLRILTRIFVHWSMSRHASLTLPENSFLSGIGKCTALIIRRFYSLLPRTFQPTFMLANGGRLVICLFRPNRQGNPELNRQGISE